MITSILSGVLRFLQGLANEPLIVERVDPHEYRRPASITGGRHGTRTHTRRR